MDLEDIKEAFNELSVLDPGDGEDVLAAVIDLEDGEEISDREAVMDLKGGEEISDREAVMDLGGGEEISDREAVMNLGGGDILDREYLSCSESCREEELKNRGECLVMSSIYTPDINRRGRSKDLETAFRLTDEIQRYYLDRDINRLSEHLQYIRRNWDRYNVSALYEWMNYFDDNETALFYAFQLKNRQSISFFLRQTSMIESNEVFWAAARYGSPKYLTRVMKKSVRGVNMGSFHCRDISILMRNEECFKAFLKEYGQNICGLIAGKHTLLSLAILFGSKESVRILLDRGADMENINSSGCPALYTAVKYRRLEIVEVLLEYGANLDLTVIHYESNNKLFRLIDYTSSYHDAWSIYIHVPFLAVSLGVCPGKMKFDHIKMSPLVFSFVKGLRSYIRFFLANLYFFPEDYEILRTYCAVRDRMRIVIPDLRLLFDHLLLQPLTLQTWSLLAVSKAISSAGHPGLRRQRVDALEIPLIFKKSLKFQDHWGTLCPKSWKCIEIAPGLERVSLDRENLDDCERDCNACFGLGKRLRVVNT